MDAPVPVDLNATAPATPSDAAVPPGVVVTPAQPTGTPLPAPPTATPSASAPRPTPPPKPALKTTLASTPTVNCRTHKCVALTFDDGPLSHTPAMLDLLAKEKVHATFFVIGENVKDRPDLVKKMVKAGHAVGSHSYSHPDLTKLTAAQIRSQLTSTSALITQATGMPVTLMRPPYGASNPTVRSVDKELGLTQILWSVDPTDWRDHNASLIAKRVLANVRPGSIVLSHDIYSATHDAYAIIIPALRKKGYTFVTVPQLLGTTAPGSTYSQLEQSRRA